MDLTISYSYAFFSNTYDAANNKIDRIGINNSPSLIIYLEGCHKKIVKPIIIRSVARIFSSNTNKNIANRKNGKQMIKKLSTKFALYVFLL